MGIELRVNDRNAVFVLPFFVLKYRRDWNARKVLKEFAVQWKAFLNGVAPFCLCLPPFLISKRIYGKKLKYFDDPPVEDVLKSVYTLTGAGIQHGELRHPENHVIIGKRVYIIDYDRGKITKNPKNLSKIVWYLSRKAGKERVYKALRALPENADVKNALRFLEHYGSVAHDR